MDNEAFILAYECDEAARGLRPRSINENTIKLRALIKRTGKTFLTITRHDLIAYLANPDLSPVTKANYRSLFHKFFTWLQDEEYRLDNPAVRLPTVRIHRNEPDPFETDELQQLLNTGMYRPTRMKILLYAYQGFRAGEIAAVAGENIDWDRRMILSKNAKGGREVWRPIHSLVWDELQRWPRKGYFFPSFKHPGKHVSAKSVSTAISLAIRRAGLIHRPHQLRAWFATQQIESGQSTQIVAAAMRHADLQSLNRYVTVSERAIRSSMETLPVVDVPRASMRRAA